jgi:hypothetical protein
MPRPAKDDKILRDKWLEVYKRNRCLTVTTCKEIGIAQDRLADWVRLYPDFAISKKEAEHLFAEKVENSLIGTAIADKPNTIAQIFYLKHNTEKYNENPNLLQPINVENLWFNKERDTKHIHTVDDDTQVLAKPSEE